MKIWNDLGIEVRDNGKAEQRTACPKCAKSESDESLGVNVRTGAFHCFRCGWKGRAGNGDGTQPIRINDASVAERKRERLRKVLKETFALTDKRAHPQRQYLIARGLGDVLREPLKVLRGHAGLEYWDLTRSLGRYPALVAMFHGANGDPKTLHVTYLRGDGCAKAAVPSPKKILGVPQRGATKGGAIRLFDVRNHVLGVAEGIESALSLHLIRKIPVWASFCADNLQHIQLPSGLRELQIGIDLDASGKGESVAQALAKRVMRASPRTKVLYVRPELDGPGDLNDEIRRRVYGKS